MNQNQKLFRPSKLSLKFAISQLFRIRRARTAATNRRPGLFLLPSPDAVIHPHSLSAQSSLSPQQLPHENLRRNLPAQRCSLPRPRLQVRTKLLVCSNLRFLLVQRWGSVSVLSIPLLCCWS
jgi:hypothetical protein